MAAKNIGASELRTRIAEGRTMLVDFWAPWCPHCRKIGPAYDEIASLYGDQLEVVKLDMDEDERLWGEMEVELIPTLRLYVDGKPARSIVAPESRAAIEEFLGESVSAQNRRDDETIYDMIVVGGGPGGYTAALYASRAGLDTLLLEKLAAGGQMALTHQIDNYPGFPDGVDGNQLAEQMRQQAERFGVQTRAAEVLSLDLRANPKAVTTDSGVVFARTVVLATGATPRPLGLPEEQALVGRGVAYCAACDGMFYRGKTVAVVGGGNTAAADALLLSRIAKRVIIVHRRDELRATKIYHKPLMQAENVEFRWNSVVTELLHGDRLTGLRLKDVRSGEESVIACDGVFVSVGRMPATELVADQLELAQGGYIAAGERTETGIPGVYAVGDVREKALRQVVTAVSDGAMAAHMAEAYLAAGA